MRTGSGAEVSGTHLLQRFRVVVPTSRLWEGRSYGNRGFGTSVPAGR